MIANLGELPDATALLASQPVPAGRSVGVVSSTSDGVLRRCPELVGADPGVDAVLGLTATTGAGDLVPEVAVARPPVPGPDGDTPAVPALRRRLRAPTAVTPRCWLRVR